MTCLYDNKTVHAVNRWGRSPMQPMCERRLDLSGTWLLKGARGGNMALVRRGLEGLGSLSACHKHNLTLPCARACRGELNSLSRFFQDQELSAGTSGSGADEATTRFREVAR